MSDNPLEQSPQRDAAIRAEAEALWKSEGSPEGGPEAYRERAEDLISIKGVPRGTPVESLPDPRLDGVQIEDARVQGNLGEFPERSTDQGDQRHFPVADRDEEAELLQDPSTDAGQPGYAQIDEKQEGP